MIAQYTHLPIYKISYDVLYRIMHATKNVPRVYKYTLGQEMKQEAMGLILPITRANSSRLPCGLRIRSVPEAP